ncbi:transglycosylase domain-containing protein [Cnuibacter sp. UC19_7]|uniref:transglycosylase domain-containing protein n=1 Tax=Cnuibacter sp. UC19_7 TaxID=3350166 RepID=UPI0036720C2A
MPERSSRFTRAAERSAELVEETIDRAAGEGRRPARTIATMLGLGVVAAVLVTAFATPAIALTNMTATGANDTFNSIPEYIKPSNLAQKSEIYSTNADGSNTLLATVFDQNRVEVGWDDISPFVKDAIVSTEDPRFYEHDGVDIASTMRALIGNLSSGGVESGASTITMQYVRNILVQQAESLDDESAREAAYQQATTESVERKLKEMRLAIGLEKEYSKDDILLGYLNIANFGGTVYGIEAAAEYYFGVSAKDLTLAQAASLAATVNEPNGLRIDNPDNIADNQARRDKDVLASMLKQHAITQQQHDEAVATPVTPNITEPTTGCQAAVNGAAYFCDYITWIIKNDPSFGDSSEQRWQNFKTGGYQIYTTLNEQLQANANETMKEFVPASYEDIDLGSTIVTVEPGTGRILAMAQNTNFDEDPEAAGPGTTAVNYNTDQGFGGSSGFQVGSTYKVFALGEWLEQGHTLSDRVSGNEKTWDMSTFKDSCGSNGGPWRPANDGSSSPGTMSVQNALTNSVNNAFVAMAQEMDLCEIRGFAESLGVHRADGDDLNTLPSSVLGTNEVAPLTMAAAYAGIAANGMYCSPVAIDRIVDGTGAELTPPGADCHQAIPQNIASTLAYAMLGPIQSGTATQSNPRDGITHIGKTGTTDNEKDTWMVGASTKAATAVWVGNVNGDTSMEDIDPNGYYGYTVRHRMWNAVMTANDEVLGGGEFPDPDDSLVYGSSSRGGDDDEKSTSTPTPAPSPTPSTVTPGTGNGGVQAPGGGTEPGPGDTGTGVGGTIGGPGTGAQ